MKTVIVTDSCCDLPIKIIESNDIKVLPITVNVKGKEVADDLGKSINYKEFYSWIREGQVPTTSQVNSYKFIEEFERHVKNGDSVIYIGFSSALSGCVNSARLAKESIEEDYVNADITIIDSKSASLGLGLIVYYASNLLKEGKSKDDVIKWIEDNKLSVNHWFTLDDLKHLSRGGRISSTAATIGTALSIKPILHVNNQGELIKVSSVKGRKKALKSLLLKLQENGENIEEQIIFISHADSINEAEYLKELIEASVKVEKIIINDIGASIGSHTGPGAIALFFIGKDR